MRGKSGFQLEKAPTRRPRAPRSLADVGQQRSGTSGKSGMLRRAGLVAATTRAAGARVRVAVGQDPVHDMLMTKAKASELQTTIVPGPVHALSFCCFACAVFAHDPYSRDVEAI